MKQYQVFYWLKMNNREYLRHMFVAAPNAREACKVCKEEVKKQTGRNAFRPTTKAPTEAELARWEKIPSLIID